MPAATAATPVNACPLCGGHKFAARPRETGFINAPAGTRVEECRRCGLCFLNPQPVVEYTKDYFDEFREKSDIAGGSTTLAGYLEHRLDRIGRIVGKGRLLEIGFAGALFLAEAARRGWEVWGVDVSRWAVEEAAAKYGFDKVFHGGLVQQRFPDAHFDCVHMNHVIEHIPELVQTVEELRRIIRPGGVVVLEVPNEFGTLQEPLRELVGVPRRPNELPSAHLWFFTPRTIARLFESHGFKGLELRTTRRNKEPESRRFGGAFVKRLVYRAEELLDRAPMIEYWAGRRP